MSTTTTTNTTTNTTASTNTHSNTNSSNSSITLTRVSADHKLNTATGESFLLQGRADSKNPARPYYHTTMQATALPKLDAASFADTRTQSALSKLFDAAVLEALKAKGAGMQPGSSITLATFTTSDVLTYIEELGNRERIVISGEELDEFCASYAMQATALVHNWAAKQQAIVAVALRQYAAPAHKKAQKDASVLLSRLEALPTLLTGEDTALDASILRIYHWLHAKLMRDAVAEAADLSASI